MYRVNILNGGRYNTVETGYRYIFTKRNVKKFLKSVVEWECDFELEKLIYQRDGIFVWSNLLGEDKWFIFLTKLRKKD